MNDKIESDGLDQRLRGVPLLGGLLAGVFSFGAGYLSFLGIAAGTGEGIEFDGQSLRQVGHFFYNSFLVPTHQQTTEVLENEVDGETVVQENVFDVWYNPFFNSDAVDTQTRVFLDGGLVEEESRTIGRESAQAFALPDLTFPDEVYLAIPVVILLAVGFIFAYRFISLDGVDQWSDIVLRGVVGGGMMTLGFLLVALVGTYAFVVDEIALLTAQTGEDAFTGPERLETLLYGFAYPALIGTTGILLGQLARRPSLDSTDTSGTTESVTEPADVNEDETTASTPSSEDTMEGTETESAVEASDETDESENPPEPTAKTSDSP